MVDDLAGFGKITEVILSSTGKAVGTLIEPWQIRRVGRARAEIEAYAIEKKAEAEAKAEIIRREHVVELPMLKLEQADIRARAGQRLITQEMNRQANIESIVLQASANAHEAEKNGAEARPLEDDWINAFLDYAQNVSNEDLRQLWARILTSQATEGAPTVSRATLDSIRLIEPTQARVFERAVRLYIAMGQIMDVDPIDGVDVGYYSQMLEATALEDLGLLKLVRDVEENLEICGGVLTFWRDVHPDEKAGDYVLWTDPNAREVFLERIVGVARGTQRDHGRLREPIRIQRQILTSRGFELASILFPNFKAYFESNSGIDTSPLGDFASLTVQEGILNQWASKLSAQGSAVTFSLAVESEIERRTEVGLRSKDSDLGRTISYDLKRIFNPDNQCWEKIET